MQGFLWHCGQKSKESPKYNDHSKVFVIWINFAECEFVWFVVFWCSFRYWRTWKSHFFWVCLNWTRGLVLRRFPKYYLYFLKNFSYGWCAQGSERTKRIQRDSRMLWLIFRFSSHTVHESRGEILNQYLFFGINPTTVKTSIFLNFIFVWIDASARTTPEKGQKLPLLTSKIPSLLIGELANYFFFFCIVFNFSNIIN